MVAAELQPMEARVLDWVRFQLSPCLLVMGGQKVLRWCRLSKGSSWVASVVDSLSAAQWVNV